MKHGECQAENRSRDPQDSPTATFQHVDSATEPPPRSGGGTELDQRTLGDYELLDRLGSGGMGVVYRARQRSANRIVALKVIRPERLEDLGEGQRQQWLERFRTEAQTAARLEHEHIVTVYDVGASDGVPYYSMRYIEGRSLAEILREGPLKNRRAAELVEPIARAVHHAHEAKILHRDLKPQNVLIDQSGRPYVADFGLAKWLEAAIHGATQTGDVIGTPSYMSPEQARDASRCNSLSDVYSLGALLYDVLTGRAPFRAATPLETLRQVIETDPVAPRELNPALERDLETITLKCLMKEPSQRYDSAAGLADDLRRYLNHEPIQARPASRVERAWRWCRRNPVVASLSALTLILLVLISVVSTAGYVTISAGLARETFDKGVALCEQGDVANGMLWMARSLEVSPFLSEQVDQVIRTNLSAWSRQLFPLQGVLQQVSAAPMPDDRRIVDSIVASTFTADAKLVLTAGSQYVQVWDAETGQAIGDPVVESSRISPAATNIVVAFSPSGKLVAAASGGTVRLLDVSTKQWIGVPMEHDLDVRTLAFSNDARTLATGTWALCTADPREFAIQKPGDVRLWEIPACKLLGEPIKHDGSVSILAFSPDDRRLVAVSRRESSRQRSRISYGSEARLWDTVEGTPVGGVLQNPIAGYIPPRFGDIEAVAFSPDSSRLVTVASGMLFNMPYELTSGTARLWDATSGEPIGNPFGHDSWFTSVAWSPTNDQILTSATDGTARFWSGATGAPIGLPLVHDKPVVAVAFGPDGQRVLTGTRPLIQGLLLDSSRSFSTGEARLWDVATRKPIAMPLQHDDAVDAVAFSSDGNTFLTQGGGVVRVWSLAANATLERSLEKYIAAEFTALAFSPYGDRIAGVTESSADVWDVETGRRILSLADTQNEPNDARNCVAWSPDGKSILSGRYYQGARLFNASNGQSIGDVLMTEAEVKAVAFDPTGEVALTADRVSIRRWATKTGELIGESKNLGERVKYGTRSVSVLAVSPDARYALASDLHSVVELRPVTRLDYVERTMRHRIDAWAGAFSRDGKRVLAGGRDGTARMWFTKSGEPVGRPLQHRGAVRAVAFSPDGRIAITGSVDQTAQLWDAFTGKRIGPPTQHPGEVTAVCFSPDGTRFATANGSGSDLRIWRTPIRVSGDAERVTLWTQCITGMELSPDGVSNRLDGPSWTARRDRLARLTANR